MRRITNAFRHRESPGEILRTVLIPCLLGAAVASAQNDSAGRAQTPEDLSLGELFKMEVPRVTGASLFEQDVTEAPSSISIITAEDIRRHGYRTLAEILNGVKGVYLSYDRNYDYVGVRGFLRPGDYNTRLLLCIDGVPANDDVYNMAGLGSDCNVDVDMIDRVEFIRGPASSVYGTSAFFGVINIITKNGGSAPGLEASAQGASFQTYRGRLRDGWTFGNGLNLLASGSAYDSKGPRLHFPEFDSTPSQGYTEGADFERTYHALASVSFKGFTLEGTYLNRKKGVPTAPWGTVFDDPDNYTIDVRSLASLRYARTIGAWDLYARVAYNQYDFTGIYTYDYAAPGDPPEYVTTMDSVNGKQLGVEAHAALHLLDMFYITFGGQFDGHLQQDQKYQDQDTVYMAIRRNSANGAGYLQGEFKKNFGAFGKVLVNAGLRYDYYRSFGGTLNPRLALIYGPREGSSIKLLYGTAFRAPNVYELYYDDGSTQKGNPDLSPERISTSEVVWEQYWGRYLRSSIAGFYYALADLITLTVDSSDGLLMFVNQASIEARGAEVELEGIFPHDIRLLASYSFQYVHDLAEEGKEPITNSPKHLVKFRGSVPFWGNRIVAAADLFYNSPRRTLLDNYKGEAFVVNATVTGRNLFDNRFLKGLGFSASVYNIFDAQYGTPGSDEHVQELIGQDGRTFRIELVYGLR